MKQIVKDVLHILKWLLILTSPVWILVSPIYIWYSFNGGYDMHAETSYYSQTHSGRISDNDLTVGEDTLVLYGSKPQGETLMEGYGTVYKQNSLVWRGRQELYINVYWAISVNDGLKVVYVWG